MRDAIKRPRRRSETYAAQGSEERGEADALFQKMAERVGFEPTEPFQVHTLSRRAH